MKHAIPSLLALATGALLTAAAQCPLPDNLTVRTLTGIYTGLIDPEFPNTRQFRSIPFAEPPVLSRRWLPPQKLSPSSQQHYATRIPPSCAQFVTSVISIYDTPLTKGNLIDNGNQNDTSGLVSVASSEDCLYLAIWTPTAPPPPGGFPVLFFMTGGGNIIGGVSIPWQLPDSWVERSQSHIVVTINYRLSIFGFPRARGLADEDQNLGILDQRVALEWVRDNIEAFGGDPRRITMYGQSAGAVDADVHSYAYYQDPIVQGYFMQSGVVFSVALPQDPLYSNFSYVAREFGCEVPCANDSAAAELDCMRQVPFAQLVNFIGQYGDRGETPTLNFNLVHDNRTYFTDYTARSLEGKIARVPALISNTANEYSTLIPWPVSNLTEGPYQPTVTALDVIRGVCATLNATAYRNRLGIPVFRMQYAGIFPNLNYYKWLGAYHASDLPITFGTYHLLDGVANTTELEVETSRALQDYLLAFIQDPYHGLPNMGWEALNVSDPHGGNVIRLGADGNVTQHVYGIEIDGACDGSREYDPFP